MSYSVYGIRHHGPGSSSRLLEALENQQPDCILIEGPSDANDLIHFIADETMKPPVALLVYPPDSSSDAVFYPFAEFSPEWNAAKFGLNRSVPVFFMDLPISLRLGFERAELEKLAQEAETAESQQEESEEDTEPLSSDLSEENEQPELEQLRPDSLTMLAEAAGFSDGEQWWDFMFEQCSSSEGTFEAIAEAVTAVRTAFPEESPMTLLREAYMRKTIRSMQKEYENIAVVCGAHHLPALVSMPTAKSDNELLSNIKKVPVQTAWTPWTNERLSLYSGYGAGIQSPGWYEFVWNNRTDAPMSYIVQAAQILRSEDIDASSASVIETVRLADTLAALRNLPRPSLAEIHEAILSVLCFAEQSRLALISKKLAVHDRMGEVSAEVPASPLQRDCEAKIKRLRLKQSSEIVTLDFDLRDERGREKSQFFYQLTLLDIPWGSVLNSRSSTGSSFKESWSVQWRPELTLQVILAGTWGNTVESASANLVLHKLESIKHLPDLTTLLNQAIYADLQEVIPAVLKKISDLSASGIDIRHCMEALEPLGSAARYGDVRGSSTESILQIILNLFERITLGLPLAAASCDDEAARDLVPLISGVQRTVELLKIESMSDEWNDVLDALSEKSSIHGYIRGRTLLLIYRNCHIGSEELCSRIRRSLSPTLPCAETAQWIEGFAAENGQMLIHNKEIIAALDLWLSELDEELFIKQLPILRRAFSDYTKSESSNILNIVSTQKQFGGAVPVQNAPKNISAERADRILPILSQILGGAQ